MMRDSSECAKGSNHMKLNHETGHTASVSPIQGGDVGFFDFYCYHRFHSTIQAFTFTGRLAKSTSIRPLLNIGLSQTTTLRIVVLRHFFCYNSPLQRSPFHTHQRKLISYVLRYHCNYPPTYDREHRHRQSCRGLRLVDVVQRILFICR